MHSINKIYLEHRSNLAVLGCAGLVVGMLLSRTALSVSMVFLLLIALLNPRLKKDTLYFFKTKTYWVLTSITLLYVIHAFSLQNPEFYLSRLRIKLPFLFLPFTFAALPRFNKKQLVVVLTLFVVTVTIVALSSLSIYIVHIRSMTEAYERAQVIPTPISHVRFSLMVAFAFIVALYSWKRGYCNFSKIESPLFLGIAVFLFIYIHILAVRSGLVGMYATFFFILVKRVVYDKKQCKGLVGIVGLLSLPFLAYMTVPTFKNKIQYARWELRKFFKGEKITNLSDSRRLASLSVGWQIAKSHPITGVGLDNIENEMDKRYQQQYPSLQVKIMPHNQFIYYAAAGGAIGFLWFLFMFFFPIYSFFDFQRVIFLSFNIIILLSLLVDITLETQIGTAFYLVFLLLFVNHFSKEEGY